MAFTQQVCFRCEVNKIASCMVANVIIVNVKKYSVVATCWSGQLTTEA